MSARSPAKASDLPYTTPTSSAPARPGPAVTATASTADNATPASAIARSTTAGSAVRCARLASSGTTPPKTLCTSCDRMMRLASSPFTRTAADVSSQDVSMPRTTSATAWRRAASQGDGVGDGARGEAARPDDSNPRHTDPRPRGPRAASADDVINGAGRGTVHRLDDTR